MSEVWAEQVNTVPIVFSKVYENILLNEYYVEKNHITVKILLLILIKSYVPE